MIELYHCYILILLFSKEHFGPNLRAVAPTQQVLGFFSGKTLFFRVFGHFWPKNLFFVIFMYDRAIPLLHFNPTFFQGTFWAQFQGCSTKTAGFRIFFQAKTLFFTNFRKYRFYKTLGQTVNFEDFGLIFSQKVLE